MATSAATKGDIIVNMFSQTRISGLTKKPTPAELDLALDRLEDMMHELTGRNICVGYNFEVEPSPDTLVGSPRKFHQMLKTNCALRILPDFGKDPTQALMAQASQSLATASSYVAIDKLQEVDYPNRMPRGNGNSIRNNRWRRYFTDGQLPPNECATKKITEDEIQDYQESFVAYLGAESIASYTISADAAITIVSSSNSTPIIDYRIQAGNNSTEGVWQQVKINITTSAGRIETRIINFEIDSAIPIGGI
jgi:hypothetical protein